MKQVKQKKQKKWAGILAVILFCGLGCVCGALFAHFGLSRGIGGGEYFGSLFLMMVGLYISIFLHIALHEGGHLLFGLLTGYKFGSFRLGSVMLVREQGRLRFRKFKLPGTGGQCLMVPPEPVNGRIPYAWYGMGGVIVNLVVSGGAFAGWLALDKGSLPALMLMMCWLFGLVLAMINGLPLPVGNVANDGTNTLTLKKHPRAMGGYTRQMQINARLMEGLRVKEMPEELFPLPAIEDMDDPFTAAGAIFVANRLLDAHQLEQTQALLEQVLEADTALMTIHRQLATCDLIYCELLGQNRPETVKALLTKELQQFMKAMAKNITILRTQYALDKLYAHDDAAAQKTLARFEKQAKTYPYTQEVQSERELIDLVNSRAVI